LSVFVTTNDEVDASILEREANEAIEAGLEGWDPADGDPIAWAGKAFSRLTAAVFDQAAKMEKAAFKRFGEAIVSVPPVQAAPASVESIWELVDDKGGYQIEDGAFVSIEASGATSAGFKVVGTTIVPEGAAKVTILLQAVEPGEQNNGLSGTAQLSTSYAFVVEPGGIVLEGVTSGGVDEEEEDAYLSRLVEANQTLSDSLILPRDFEIDGRAEPGVARVKCIRNYDADKEEDGVALCQSVFPITAEGQPPSEPVREALLKRQQEKLLTDVQHHVGVPTYTEVDGETEIEVVQGFDPATTEAAVEARWAEIFDPANRGKPKQGDSGSGWINEPFVYYLKLVGELERVGGVGRVVSLKIAKHGDALGTANLELDGVAPLTEPGTFVVSAV
jgi:hypothetical protein